MIITDITSNFFSKLKNGFLNNTYKIEFKKSKQIVYILSIFLKEGLIKGYKIKNENIIIYLKYKNNQSVIKNIKKISKPGKRFFVKNKDLFKKEEGLLIISTSKGILTGLEVKKNNLGGELIGKIFF